MHAHEYPTGCPTQICKLIYFEYVWEKFRMGQWTENQKTKIRVARIFQKDIKSFDVTTSYNSAPSCSESERHEILLSGPRQLLLFKNKQYV